MVSNGIQIPLKWKVPLVFAHINETVKIGLCFALHSNPLKDCTKAQDRYNSLSNLGTWNKKKPEENENTNYSPISLSPFQID